MPFSFHHKEQKMKLLIPVSAGVEASVKRQLKYLGYGDCPANEGRIAVEGGWEDIARLNVFLRSGERVLLCLSTFHAATFDELYEGVYSLPWEEFFTPHTHILIDGKCVKSALMAIKAAGGVAKKAILNRLREKFGVSTFDEKGERAVVGISIFEDVATVTLDTSGDGLHKRGYRVLSYDAPLRETTAAAIVESSVFHPEKPLADLFCGSGTIPIEAALLAQNIAPGLLRTFDFTAWKNAPPVLPRAKEEAKDCIIRGKQVDIFGGDLSPRAIEIARFHAKRAGVQDIVRFACADMREFHSSKEYGVLISNPPYGERLSKGENLKELYVGFSKTFRALKDWSCYFITSYMGAERAFGKPADKRRKLFNANLECCLYTYLGKKPPKNLNVE